MHNRRPGVRAARIDDSAADGDNSASEHSESKSEIVGPHGRLILERRQRNPVEHSWPDALDSLHRHLVGIDLANKALQESEKRYRSIFEEAPVGLFQMSPGGQLLDLNGAMARILGFESAEQVLAEAAKGDSPRIFRTCPWDEQAMRVEDRMLQTDIDLHLSCRNGAKKWVRFNIREVLDGGRQICLEGSAEDVTNRKLAEIRTELLAYYDLLTGLPNRTLFRERFQEILAAAREQNRSVALLLLELDGFKAINDSLGEMFGDRLLQEMAARLRTGTSENCVVARVGGAEFAIVNPDVVDIAQVEAAAEDLVEDLSADHSFLGHSLTATCNVGISMFPANGKECETLVKRADIAKSRSREENARGFSVFTEELDRELVKRETLESGLRQALARNELFLEYQPQVDVRTGAITGLEALLRWNHSELGLIPPNDFIEIAENSGLIVPIGEWVMRTACTQARAWQQSGLPSVPIAVNVSAIQFRRRGFCELVHNILKETGLSPELLELELTETLLLTNADLMSLITARLRAMGVMLAIDDFGTGYSSLGYLKHFKVNRLKIARSFIKDIPGDADDVAITIAFIEMARALNLAVLAEGVEEADQLLFLRKQECYTIQGFYFSRPASADKAGELLRTGFGHMI
jgi:diguanylate cyclase (GGDEF)-like protein/PAS domain S-box-containing protein